MNTFQEKNNIKVMDVPESKHATIPELSQKVNELLKK